MYLHLLYSFKDVDYGSKDYKRARQARLPVSRNIYNLTDLNRDDYIFEAVLKTSLHHNPEVLAGIFDSRLGAEPIGDKDLILSLNMYDEALKHSFMLNKIPFHIYGNHLYYPVEKYNPDFPGVFSIIEDREHNKKYIALNELSHDFYEEDLTCFIDLYNKNYFPWTFYYDYNVFVYGFNATYKKMAVLPKLSKAQKKERNMSYKNSISPKLETNNTT